MERAQERELLQQAEAYGFEVLSLLSVETTIRCAELEDATALHEVQTASVRGLCSRCYTPEIIEGWLLNRTPEGYRAPILAGSIFIAERGLRIVGFSEAIPGTVVRLYVHPTATGQGVGSALLARALAVAAHGQLGPVQLESTLNAQSFYERFGFQKIAQVAVQCNHVRIPVVLMERVRAGPFVQLEDAT